MDINAIVYGNAKASIPARPDIFIDEDAEARRSRPWPLNKPAPTVQPRPVSVISDYGDDYDEESNTPPTTKTIKHESYDLSGTVYLITNEGKTLSLPVPSDSKHDPLNWGRWKSSGVVFALVWAAVTVAVAEQATATLLHGIMKDFPDTKASNVQTLSTAPTLFMGLGALFWIPLSLALGRRPVFLLATVLGLISSLNIGYANSFPQLLLCTCTLGFAEGFSLTNTYLMIIDLTFIHQRTVAIAGLWSSITVLVNLLGVTVPYLSADGLDWRLFYQRWSIPMGIAIPLAFFLSPETYFKRPTVAFNGLILMQTATEKLTIYKDEDYESDLYRDLPEFPIDDVKQKGYVHLIGLGRSPFASFKSLGACYIQITFCLANPLIFWVLIASVLNFASMMFIGSTFGVILSKEPYNIRPTQLTVVNVSSGIGAIFAFFFAAFCMTYILKHLSRRNKGVREAEHYLPIYVPAITLGALSTLVYGLAVYNQWGFSVYCVAYAMNGFSWVSISIGNTLWVTEAFPHWAAPALAVVGGGCYIFSYGISFALQPWIASHGYLLVGVELAIAQIASGIIALPIAFWGKSLRQRFHGRWADDRGGALRPL